MRKASLLVIGAMALIHTSASAKLVMVCQGTDSICEELCKTLGGTLTIMGSGDKAFWGCNTPEKANDTKIKLVPDSASWPTLDGGGNLVPDQMATRAAVRPRTVTRPQ